MFVSFQGLRGRGRRYLGVALMAALAGCSRYQAPGLPAAPPVGINVRAIEQTQVEGALADKLTVYRHEWAGDGDTLGDYGNRHLEEIAGRAAETDHPILVERVADAKLNESRREFLVRYLADRQVSDANNRVIIGRPIAAGESAENSIEVYQLRPSSGSGR